MGHGPKSRKPCYAISAEHPIAAVEWRNWLRTELNAELTTLEIVNATSRSSLCENVVGNIARFAS